MATHPFAIKLENAIEKAKRIRDAMKRSKEAPVSTEPMNPNLAGSTNTGEVINLGEYGIGGEQRVDPGGATKLYSAVPTPGMARLLQQLATEERKCAERQRIVQTRGEYRDVGGKQVWFAGRASVVGRVPCPGVTRIRNLIRNFKGERYTVTRTR